LVCDSKIWFYHGLSCISIPPVAVVFYLRPNTFTKDAHIILSITI
jgi:hypothetical protein